MNVNSCLATPKTPCHNLFGLFYLITDSFLTFLERDYTGRICTNHFVSLMPPRSLQPPKIPQITACLQIAIFCRFLKHSNRQFPVPL